MSIQERWHYSFSCSHLDVAIILLSPYVVETVALWNALSYQQKWPWKGDISILMQHSSCQRGGAYKACLQREWEIQSLHHRSEGFSLPMQPLKGCWNGWRLPLYLASLSWTCLTLSSPTLPQSSGIQLTHLVQAVASVYFHKAQSLPQAFLRATSQRD